MFIRRALIDSLRHAFAVEGDQEASDFDDEERALADRVAAFIVRRRMTAPAVMLLESSRPLNFLGSQLLAFLAPYATLLFSADEYDHFVRFLEKRSSVDLILDSIAKAESRG